MSSSTPLRNLFSSHFLFSWAEKSACCSGVQNTGTASINAPSKVGLFAYFFKYDFIIQKFFFCDAASTSTIATIAAYRATRCPPNDRFPRPPLCNSSTSFVLLCSRQKTATTQHHTPCTRTASCSVCSRIGNTSRCSLSRALP